MDYPEGVKEELDRITALDPENLTDYDLGFLRARQSYLDYQQTKKFEKVLGVEIAAPKVAEDLPFDGVVTEAPPKPKAKKK